MSYTIDSSIRAKNYNKTARKLSSIKYIVLHYTANTGTTATAKSNANYFKNTTRNASAHYVVDEKNIVYNCVPLTNAAYAVGDTQKYPRGSTPFKGICTNSNSVSIEMVSHTDSAGKYYIPDATETHAIELTRSLMKELNIPIENVITHGLVTGKLCPATHFYTSEGEKKWAAFKARLIEQEEEEVTQAQFNEMMTTYLKEVAAKDGASWSQGARDWAINAGIFTGDGTGNYQWKSDVTREQLATILQRVLEK